jgi:hypothetical protein
MKRKQVFVAYILACLREVINTSRNIREFCSLCPVRCLLGVKFQILISALNDIILNTGLISTKIALQRDVKHGLYMTTFQYRFSKLKSTTHATWSDLLILHFRERIVLVHINYYKWEKEILSSAPFLGGVTKTVVIFYVHVTVHCEKFPYNKTNQMH